MAFDTPIYSNDQSIDRVLAAGLPIALVFLQGQPSAELKQAMERLAKMYSGKLLVVQVNPQDNPETARRFQMTRSPGLITLQKGQSLTRAESITGIDLQNHVNYLLGKGSKPEPPPAQARPVRPMETTGARGPVSGQPQAVTDATFDQVVLHSSHPVLVDFWAPWCGPCRMTEPVVEKLSRELAGRMVVAKINVDENPAISSRFGVQSIPTMMLVKNGQIVDRWVGALPEPAIRSRVSAIVQ